MRKFILCVLFVWITGHGLAADVKYEQVVHVYDGDTVKLSNGMRVRLIGIDTPETRDNDKLERDLRKHQQDRQTVLAMGQEAASFTKKLLLHKDVRLEFDVQQRDKYNRVLAYLFLPDGTFVNAAIVREGYAYPYPIPPNVRYAGMLRELYQQAKNNHKGLWKNGGNHEK